MEKLRGFNPKYNMKFSMIKVLKKYIEIMLKAKIKIIFCLLNLNFWYEKGTIIHKKVRSIADNCWPKILAIKTTKDPINFCNRFSLDMINIARDKLIINKKEGPNWERFDSLPKNIKLQNFKVIKSKSQKKKFLRISLSSLIEGI